MKVAVAAQSGAGALAVHAQFGRCDCFMIADTETGDMQTLPNDSADAATGAGTGCAQAVIKEGVEAVISGQIGPNAHEVLKAGGVSMYRAPAGISVQEALEKFKAGSLQKMEIKRF